MRGRNKDALPVERGEEKSQPPAPWDWLLTAAVNGYERLSLRAHLQAAVGALGVIHELFAGRR
jgi:hypothetical protein